MDMRVSRHAPRPKSGQGISPGVRRPPGAYGTVDEVLKDDEVDAVYIGTPVQAHASQTSQATEHGKHVLCEKPMATSVEEGERMVRAYDANGVKQMGATISGSTGALEDPELLEAGEIGRAIRGGPEGRRGTSWRAPQRPNGDGEPDGDHLYAGGQGDNVVGVFSWNSTTGALTFVGVHRDRVAPVDGLDSALSVTVSPDGKHVYTAGFNDNAVAVFRVAGEPSPVTIPRLSQRGLPGAVPEPRQAGRGSQQGVRRSHARPGRW